MASTDKSLESIDDDQFEIQCREDITHWVKEQLGGDVFEITRLERWRPQWKVCYNVDGQQSAVLFRGNRPNAGKHDLRFEMDVMEVLEKNDIAVPHIYGWADAPKAFVMDWIETDDRAPGMLHTAIENPSTMSDERWQAMLSYMEHLAQVHKIPTSEFSHIRRLTKLPRTPQEIAMHANQKMYNIGEHFGNIDTSLEFLQQWLLRNIPEHRSAVNFVCGDAGQFMSAGTDVLALLDFEIANVGDTHWDLACFRGRHPYENMGDIPALYRRYEEITGEPVDLPVVCYYTVAFLQLAAIGATFFGSPEMRGGNWIEGTMEHASINRRAYEGIAELNGYSLDYNLELPTPVSKPWEESGLKKLMVDIDRLPTSSAFTDWERDLLHAIPKFLLNYSQYRDWFEEETIDDISSLTQEKYENLEQADGAAMELIKTSVADDDEQWVKLMHRRSLRLSMIIAGTNPDDTNPLFHKLDPILNI
jgi:aminoglycoside phosphotransferase (APT) family kinase protein